MELPDLEVMNAAFRDYVPHNKALGLTITGAKLDPPRMELVLPWHEQLVGNPETGMLHGGPVTALMDAGCGAAVFLFLGSTEPIATLDLRVDFLGKPPARRDVRCIAECIHATSSVAFARAKVFVDDENAPFALATATFALNTRGRALTADEFAKGGAK